MYGILLIIIIHIEWVAVPSHSSEFEPNLYSEVALG